ncbi:MAG: TetR/AcrR family transcriptional regulator [Cyanobacteria bacterium P01_H01_bin.119]
MPAAALTRQKLIQSALKLFVSQGVSNTTTRQIANRAEVNEVTLFRHFGNKYGLLLAVLEESTAFMHLGETLVQQLNFSGDMNQALKNYASAYLHALDQVAPLVRSVIGEAEAYPPENRQALGQGLTRANHHVAQYFATVIQQGQLKTLLPPEKLASLLNGMLLGYATVELTTESHQLWESEADFLEQVRLLFLQGAIAPYNGQASLLNGSGELSPSLLPNPAVLDPAVSDLAVVDLPASMVHQILKQTRKVSPQAYAIAYVLFGAGLSAEEVINLKRMHQICDSSQHVLQIMTDRGRQVPINQWIFGKRYGSYTSNPLTRWLKSRKDSSPAMFLSEATAADADKSLVPLDLPTLMAQWQTWVDGLLVPQGHVPGIAQAQPTWCVEMLMRGVTLENLSILTGQPQSALRPYDERAKQKAALEQATQLDRKSS